MKNFSSLSFPLNTKVLPLAKVGTLLGSVLIGQWLISDVAHIPGGGIGILVVGFGAWYFLQPAKPSFKAPSSVQGWISRCNEVLEQFEFLEGQEDFLRNRKKRVKSLEEILDRSFPQKVSFTGTSEIAYPEKSEVSTALSVTQSLNLSYNTSLPIRDDLWQLPQSLVEQDAIIYVLPVPLRAVDLLWLKKIPEDQPSWLMISWEDCASWTDQLKDLQAQLPERWSSRIIRWNMPNEEMKNVLSPIRRVLDKPKINIDSTKQRLLSRLHSSWQSDLEQLRREKFKLLQNRSQWIVASAVFASPLPSGDLLSVAVVNGLMINEMAKIWSCKMNPELLQAVARQLACAAVAQGVVEWSGQALLGVAKLDGTSWIAAGSMQALSAAYLTRVVGRSMADWMAINNGLSEPDLELLNQQVSQLVSNAAEQERVDWRRFLKQGKDWIELQVGDNSNSEIVEA
ncbi:YcjF family protein [Prochlorococcus sp. MIT 1223]|uniref:YcjF family protein n=1 Tax=Prochlorococcus sp. MIT 1223 TaxID=3096217 RepID=UPI002A75BBFD|nr:YcjF family protein [Prochlorococcus sp. MIT 1223]